MPARSTWNAPSVTSACTCGGLVRAIDEGRFTWDRVFELGPESRMLPTGILSSWPDGSPLTVHTLAAWMIFESDNTARELCALVAELQGLDLMTINPGVDSAAQFERVAVNGGSEPGVLNLTTWVRTIDGREACVCAMRNANEDLDTADLGGVVGAAFGLVRKR